MPDTSIPPQPDFGEIVTALKRFAPDALTSIRNAHPNEADAIFRSGMTLGTSEDKEPLLCSLGDRVPPRGVSAALLGSVELPVRLPELAS